MQILSNLLKFVYCVLYYNAAEFVGDPWNYLMRNLTLEDNNVRVFNGLVMDLIYLTAKGNLSCYGDGSYDFLDQLSNQYSISSYALPDFYMSHLSSSSIVDGKVLKKSKSWKKKK